MGYEGFTKLKLGLYRDNKTGKIGKLKPTGHGGWYVEDITELPKIKTKREEYIKYKAEQLKQDYEKTIRELKGREKNSLTKAEAEDYNKRWNAVVEDKKEAEELINTYNNPEEYKGNILKTEGKHIDKEVGLKSRDNIIREGLRANLDKDAKESVALGGDREKFIETRAKAGISAEESNEAYNKAREDKSARTDKKLEKAYSKYLERENNEAIGEVDNEPSFLKGATQEERENYYRNKAERDKMKKMGTTAYLMEKEREKGNYKDEKVNTLQRKANEVVKGMANDKLNKGEAFQNKNGAVVEIINKDENGWTTYSLQTSPTTPPSYRTFQENVKGFLKENSYEKVGNKYATNNGSGSDDNTSAYADKAIKYWEKQREDTIARGGDTCWEDDSIKKWEKEKENRLYGERLNNDISPMSEWSDTTGTGYSDKQTKALESGAYDKRTATELKKATKKPKTWEEELQVGNKVITRTGTNGTYGIRNVGDEDDPMTDYSAYVYGFNAKSIIEKAREEGIVVDKPVSKKVKNTEAKIERYRQRKQGNTLETMSKRQLATRIAELQAERGIIPKENIDKHITRKMRDYSKKQLMDYFK